MIGAAFSPSGISSFFEVCTKTKDGTNISNPLKIGSRGGGFALKKGVTTKVSIKNRRQNEDNVKILINGREAPEAKTTKKMIDLLLKNDRKRYDIIVQHIVEVPVGAGFGTSAAGALSCGLALSDAINLPLTYNQIAQAAHVADIECQTGLGTVEGLTIGGLVLIVESGALGYGLIDRILIRSDLQVVAGVFKSVKKSSVLLSEEKVNNINAIAKKTMSNILKKPDIENFLNNCKSFAYESGLASDRVKQLIKEVEDAGAIGATQNMIGEAVHAITTENSLDDVYKTFTKHISEDKIIISKIDFKGAKIL
jgi:pantoate kinase